jgi:tight adherence protein B
MEIPLLIGLLIALAILAIFIGLGRAIEVPASNRLEDYLSDQLPGQGSMSALRSRRLSSAGDLVLGVDKIVRSASAGESLARLLRQADLQTTAAEYLALWLAVVALGLIAGLALAHHWIAAVLCGLLGTILPYMFLGFRRSNRLRDFNNQLHTVLMQLSGSLRAGFGLQQAIDFVAHETPAPAGKEFAQVLRDIRLGQAAMDALESMIERMPSDDLRLIITAIRIHYEVGGNLAEILENVSETIRERVRIKGELRALTAQQRMAGYVLAALPVIVFFLLMLLNPNYESRLFMPGPTLCIPVGALVMMVSGFLIIRRFIQLDV